LEREGGRGKLAQEGENQEEFGATGSVYASKTTTEERVKKKVKPGSHLKEKL